MVEPAPTRFSDGLVQPNRHIMQRLDAMYEMLLNAHRGSSTMSSASKGGEREHFVQLFLSQVFPPHFRFGSGDITDSDENKSGQIDIVIEYPNLYSFPLSQSSQRLYLAEGVAVALEIKSSLANQWPEVEKTATKIKQLKRRFQNHRMREMADRYRALKDDASQIKAFQLRESAEELQAPPEDIPLFVVGYSGWANVETLAKRFEKTSVDAVLQLDNQFFVSRKKDGIFKGEGYYCLLMFLEFITSCLHDSPPQSSIFHYAKQVPDDDAKQR